MKRSGQVIRLKPEMREEYLRLHAEPWPSILETLKRCHIQNYSIFLHADLLFSYYEYMGDNWELDRQQMAADPATRAWWQLTDPCQTPLENAPEGAWWLEMPSVFFME